MRCRAAMNPIRQQWQARAFSLIENMVALAIVSIGLLGSGGLFAEALAQFQSNSQRRAAIIFGAELADQIIAARAEIARHSAGECSPGLDACFGDPSLETWVTHWRNRLRQSLPGAGVSMSIAHTATAASYKIEIHWADRHNAASSEQFGFVLHK